MIKILTTSRAADRKKMVLAITAVAQAAGFTAAVEPLTQRPRSLDLTIRTSHGLNCLIGLNGDLRGLETDFMGHWYVDSTSDARLVSTFARGSVNPYHWHKATTHIEGFDTFLQEIGRLLGQVRDGSAFQPS